MHNKLEKLLEKSRRRNRKKLKKKMFRKSRRCMAILGVAFKILYSQVPTASTEA